MMSALGHTRVWWWWRTIVSLNGIEPMGEVLVMKRKAVLEVSQHRAERV